METITHECYVSLEVAKLLKQAGFDWGLNSRWQDWGGKNPHEFILKTDLLYADGPAEYDGFHALPAPTLSIAQRWLREVMNIDVYIFPDTNVKRECVYQVGLKTFGRTLWMPGQPSTAQYNTYEEAQESGIKKALEIILECK